MYEISGNCYYLIDCAIVEHKRSSYPQTHNTSMPLMSRMSYEFDNARQQLNEIIDKRYDISPCIDSLLR